MTVQDEERNEVAKTSLDSSDRRFIFLDKPSLVETLVLALLLAGLTWAAAPHVNESHYLVKAKHFWDPAYCAEDVFLSSVDTHWIAFGVLGFPTRFVSLEATAWIGRILCWSAVSFGFVCLGRAWTGRRWRGLIIGPWTLVLNEAFHLSGEWFSGGAEGKSLAYAVALLAIAAMVADRWRFAWPLLGVSACLHVLVGGWVMVVSLAVRFGQQRRQICKDVPAILLGALLALPGLLPAALQNRAATAEQVELASMIQVTSRLSHHLYAVEFGAERAASFAILACVLAALMYWTRSDRQSRFISALAAASMCLVAIGLLLSVWLWVDGSQAVVTRLLSLYWFRVADVLVPLAVALLGLRVAEPILAREATGHLIQCVIILVFAVVLASHQFSILDDPRPPAVIQAQPVRQGRQHAIATHRNWRRVCDWCRQNTPATAQFITPSGQQTFKWYAARAEVANWKDMPQDAPSIVIWSQRLDDLYVVGDDEFLGLLAHRDVDLIELGRRYEADYLLVLQRHVDRRKLLNDPVSLERVYPVDPSRRTTFEVYRFPDR